MVLCVFLGGGNCTKKDEPNPFENLPNQEKNGLILESFNFEIREPKIAGKEPLVDRPFNPSIVRIPKGALRQHQNAKYLMSFRFMLGDRIWNQQSFIGLVELNEAFEQIDDDISVLETLTKFDKSNAEDARLAVQGDEIWVSYNDLGSTPSPSSSDQYRLMQVGLVTFKVGKNAWTLSETRRLDTRRRLTEKNWVPFLYDDQWYYSVSLTPHVVAYQSGKYIKSLPGPCQRMVDWKWGTLRGGTPASLIEFEGAQKYLAFFHSSKVNPSDGFRQYVMGAYLFDSDPPFCLTHASAEPIIFPDIYQAPVSKIDWTKSDPFTSGIHVVFPGGFVEFQAGGLAQIALAYGVADSQVSMMYLDRQKLLKSLKKSSERNPGSSGP